MSETFDKIIERPKFWDKYSRDKALAYDRLNRLDKLFDINAVYGSNRFRLILTLDGNEILNKKILINTSIEKYYDEADTVYKKSGYTIKWTPKYPRMIIGGIDSVGEYIATIKYTITFKVDDTIYDTIIADEDTLISTLKLPADPEKKYYKFDGWDTLPKKLTGNITVNAVFTPNPPDVFIFKLDNSAITEYGIIATKDGIYSDASSITADVVDTIFNDTDITVSSYAYDDIKDKETTFDIVTTEMMFVMTKSTLGQPHFYDAQTGEADYGSVSCSVQDITGFYETDYKLICYHNSEGLEHKIKFPTEDE